MAAGPLPCLKSALLGLCTFAHVRFEQGRRQALPFLKTNRPVRITRWFTGAYRAWP